jgi:four helix bundle protein
MLRIYKDVLRLIRLLVPTLERIRRRDADLARQMTRALESVALNLQEGGGVSGGNRRLRNQTAWGSAREVQAAIDVAEAFEFVELGEVERDLLDKVNRTLAKLAR